MLADGECLKLNKALYGLKQAPRAWKSTFNAAIVDLGFQALSSDQCVYFNSDKRLYLLIYVDDGLVIGTNENDCKYVIDKLATKFALVQLSGDQFLGIKIERVANGGVKLTQERYVTDILKRFNMTESKAVSSPMVDLAALADGKDTGTTNGPYREAVGCLMYLACCTRPDIMFAVSILSRFNSCPKEIHWTAAKRVMKYLKGTSTRGLQYQALDTPEIRPVVYSDADWAGDQADRRSTSGVAVVLGGGLVMFSARKQGTVALSSAEAEYVVACEAGKDLKWLVQFLGELEIEICRPLLLIDNQSTIKQIENSDTKRRSKHIDLKFHFIRQQYQAKAFELESVETENQVADLLTKPLAGSKIEWLLGCVRRRPDLEAGRSN